MGYNQKCRGSTGPRKHTVGLVADGFEQVARAYRVNVTTQGGQQSVIFDFEAANFGLKIRNTTTESSNFSELFVGRAAEVTDERFGHETSFEMK